MGHGFGAQTHTTYSGRYTSMSYGIPSMTRDGPDNPDGQDQNVARLIELGVLLAGYVQLGAHGLLARELRNLVLWIGASFARKRTLMRQAIDKFS